MKCYCCKSGNQLQMMKYRYKEGTAFLCVDCFDNPGTKIEFGNLEDEWNSEVKKLSCD